MRSQVSHQVVGRDGLLADLVGWLEPALSGRGRSVLLTGEPGIGKSTLIEALAQRADGAGFRVVRGWCAEAGMPPYWPWRPALQASAEVARLEAVAGSAVDWAAPADGADERASLFAAVVEALEAAGRERPLFIAIDDVHWADPSSLRLLHTVAAAVPALSVALVLTAREDPVDVPDATRRALVGLPTSLRRVAVPPLEDRWVALLVRQVAGSDLADEAVSSVVSRTGGNPFFVTEVARLLALGAAAAVVVVPAGIREAVQRRLARLPQSCYALLMAAAVAGESATGEGDPIEEGLVAAVCAIDVSTVVERLDDAVRAGLVAVAADDRSGLRFRHALIREALVAGASIVERGHLHRRVAEILSGTAGGVEERLAYHWARAAGLDAAEQAGHWSEKAAESAVRVLAFEQAAGHLQRALAGPDADQVGLRVRLGEAQRLAGNAAEARATLVEAARLAEDQQRPEDMAAAALGLGGGVTGFEVSIADEVQVDLLRRAERALPDGDTAGRAAVLARLSLALTGLAGERERRLLAERALGMADRCGEPRVLVAALAAWCDAAAGPDYVRARLANAERMTSLAQDRVSQLLARRLALVAHLERGDLATVDALVESYDRVADAGGVALLYRWLPAVWRGMRALLAGDIPAAFGWASTAEEIGVRAGSGNAALLVFTLRMHAHLLAGTAAEYVAATRDVMAQVQPLPLPVTYLAAPAVLLLAAGDEGPGRSVLRRYHQTRPENIAADGEWLEGHWALAELAVRLEDRAAAARLLDTLRPYERLWAVDGVGGAAFGVVGHQLGALAAFLGRQREATTFLRTALESYVEACAPLLADQIRSTVGGLGVAAGPAPVATTALIRRDGRFWRLMWHDRTIVVPDGKGIRDLAVLLTQPHRPVSALDLVEAGGGPAAAAVGTDLGPTLDRQARRAYQDRVLELDADIAAAESDADLARVERLRAERTMVADELAGALGLGGRPRTVGDPVDRARKAVTMRIRAVLRTLDAEDPALARHLRNAVRTGRMCVYEPDTEITWRS
jgi:hypothetical protein